VAVGDRLVLLDAEHLVDESHRRFEDEERAVQSAAGLGRIPEGGEW